MIESRSYRKVLIAFRSMKSLQLVHSSESLVIETMEAIIENSRIFLGFEIFWVERVDDERFKSSESVKYK